MSQLTVVEDSPQGRYKKYNECLGTGSYKKVYRGFDTNKGRDVAWNEIFVSGLPQKEKERFASEVELLRLLHNEHFIEYYSSWYDAKQDKIVLITQIVIGGTLNNYVKNKELNMEVIKNWCIQILEALNYLHTLDPPIIHRDLKCSNIFIESKTSKIIIGDLGLSKRRSDEQMSIAGTPEFMAPEIFANGVYDEKVDIYAFGMCILELITRQVPYSECKSIRDIYDKVTNGILPECLDDVKDEEAKKFITKLIGKAPTRPSAKELLSDPFLTQSSPSDREIITIDNKREMDIKEGDPDWGNAAELATSASTIVEEITEVSEEDDKPIKYNSNPSSIVKDDIKKDLSVMETQPSVASSHPFHKRSSSISYSNQSFDNSMSSLKTSHKDTKTVTNHHRSMSTLSAHKAGSGSGNLSPSMVAVQSPERRVHTYTTSRENIDASQGKSMKENGSENENTIENSDSQQNYSKQLEIMFADDKNEARKKMNGEKVIENMIITLANQNDNIFTFHISYTYYYVGELEKKENLQSNCEYVYGIDTPEKFVSKIVQDGIIEEYVLDELSSYFDDWFIQNLLMEMRLKPTEEDIDNEILEEDIDNEIVEKDIDNEIVEKDIDNEIVEKVDSEIVEKDKDNDIMEKVDSEIVEEDVDSEISENEVDNEIVGKVINNEIVENDILYVC